MANKIGKTKHTGSVANVPVVMQLEALECGAASLTMIMAYYGKWVPLEEVRAESGVSRDGANAINIIKAGNHYGLESHGYKYDVQSLIQEGSFPCIIHWELNHFVVLDGFKGNYAIINDPARGRVKVPMEQFDKSFTGIVLEFSPTENFVADGKPHSVIEFARKRLVTARSALVFMIVMFAIFSILGLIQPLFPKIFIDSILVENNVGRYQRFIGIFTVFTLLSIGASVFNNISSLRIKGKLAVCGASSYMWKIINMPMEFFSQRHVADLQNRKEDNTEVASTIIGIIAPAVIDVVVMLFYLTIMIKYSLFLTLIGIASIGINILLGLIISKLRVNISSVGLRDEGLLDSATFNNISMIETIKASGAESSVFSKWAGHQANYNNDIIRSYKLESTIGAIPGYVSSLTNIIISILGVYLAMSGEFTVGMIMAFQGLFQGFVYPVNELIESGQAIMEMKTKMERIEDVMSYPCPQVFKEDVYKKDDPDLDKVSGDIVLKNVTFGYSKLEDPLIKKFNLTIKQGSRVAIVGPSGCGKSTLAKLLSGLYQPWEGTITFGGKEHKDIEKTVFTSSLAVVDQNIILFEDTIQNNITMWNESIEDYEMILAAKDAQIHDDIMSRQGGYQHKMIENGRNFSGGQRQRIEIARALAMEPNYIIMDEATSALDAKTENDVVNAINDRGITTIVVAHRLSTIRNADLILVLKHGKIIEKGTHKELMEKGGLYTKLVTSE